MSLDQIHHRLNDDLEFFAENAPLVIKDDQGHLVPFKLNIAQRYAHAKLEEQRKKKGSKSMTSFACGHLYTDAREKGRP